MTPINKINLSAKLVLLFLLTGIAIIIVFGISAGSGFKKHFQDSLNPHLYQYFNYINSEIGSPPDLKKAQQLSESLNIKTLLKGTHINWSSDDSLNEFPEHLLPPHFDKGEQYMSTMERGRFAIHIPNATHQATFITQHKRETPSLWKLLSNTLLGLFLVLGLLYLVLCWMISPLQQIQAGISRIGSGELDYRIKITRQDKLGSLATEINKMADDTDLLEAERLSHRHQKLHLSQITINQLIGC